MKSFSWNNLSNRMFFCILFLVIQGCVGCDPLEIHKSSSAGSGKSTSGNIPRSSGPGASGLSSPSSIPPEKIKEFHSAIASKNLNQVKELLNAYPKLVDKPQNGEYPIIVALKFDNHAIAQFILSKNPNLGEGITDSDNNNPLLLAVKAGIKNKALVATIKQMIAQAPLNQYMMPNKTGEAVIDLLPKIKDEELKKSVIENFPLISFYYNKEEGEQDLSQKSDSIENEYVLIKKNDDDLAITIKKAPPGPILIKKDGSIIDDLSVENIPSFQIGTVHYVLLPQDHWFAKHFEFPDFKSIAGVFRPRSNIWGRELKVVKKDKKSVLYKKMGKIGQPDFSANKISDSDFTTNFQPAFTQLLGNGGEGEVFAFNFKGRNYALKRFKKDLFGDSKTKFLSETKNIELLQFTQAVVSLYGAFSHKNEYYIILEKGEKSLNDVIRKKEKVSEKLLIDAAISQLRLRRAYGSLKIHNKDIKPGNFLLINNVIKAIDIDSSGTTRGYEGTQSHLMARVLLETYLGVFLEQKTSNFIAMIVKNPSPTQWRGAATKEYWSYWKQSICTSQNLPASCLNQSAQEILNSYIKSTSKKDLSDLMEEAKLEKEKLSQLIFPQNLEVGKISWNKYFSLKDNRDFVNIFCQGVLRGKILYQKFTRTYQKFCKHDPKSGDYKFTMVFKNEQDKNFQQWIFDAYSPLFKQCLWEAILLEGPGRQEQVFKYIYESEVKPYSPKLYEVLIKLDQY